MRPSQDQITAIAHQFLEPSFHPTLTQHLQQQQQQQESTVQESTRQLDQWKQEATGEMRVISDPVQ